MGKGGGGYGLQGGGGFLPGLGRIYVRACSPRGARSWRWCR